MRNRIFGQTYNQLMLILKFATIQFHAARIISDQNNYKIV